jgi:hypothetical protein
MVLGKLISEYQGRITSVKALPFDSSGQGVKYEVTQVGELSGRLSGRGVGSNFVQLAADGTSTAKFYDAFITNDGETILAESGGMSVPRTNPFMDRRVRMHTRKTRPLAQQFLLGSSLVVLAVGLLVQAPRAAARDSPDAPAERCTARNVAGAYGFLGSGTILPNPFLPEGPIATVGILTFDGQEGWRTTNQSLTVNGQVTTGVSMTGTYTVNPDCTFTLVDAAGNTDAGVFVHDRQEGFFMATVEGVVVTFTMKRIEKKD